MQMTPNNGPIPLSFTDYSFTLMDDKVRELDFVIIMELMPSLTFDHLEKGAKLAFENYPQSNSIILGKNFVPASDAWKMETAIVSDVDAYIKKYIQTPFDLSKERGIKQLYLKCGEKVFLVTRFHHALGDFISFLLWIKTQFSHERESHQALKLKPFLGKRPIKTAYAYSKKALVVGGHTGKVSSDRSWSVCRFPKIKGSLKSLEFSYNDLLCAILFETMREYNKKKGLKEQRNCLYLPINVRENPFVGFGNGTSRIKVYDCYEGAKPFAQIAKLVREQVEHCRRTGFWAIPAGLGFLKYMPQFLAKFLVATIGLRLSEPGSLIFTHAERFSGFESVFSKIKSLDSVSQLYRAYPLVLSATTNNDLTTFALTRDAALMSESDANLFTQILKQKQIQAYRELESI